MNANQKIEVDSNREANGQFGKKGSDPVGGTDSLGEPSNPNAIDLSDNGRFAPLNAVVVMPGEAYGRDNCLTNQGDQPLVEFYDARYPHTPDGQFVSRYYLSALADRDTTRDLDLQGDVASWTATAENTARAVEFAQARVRDAQQ